jgi:tRNA (mo5U34)-methyltransferase
MVRVSNLVDAVNSVDRTHALHQALVHQPLERLAFAVEADVRSALAAAACAALQPSRHGDLLQRFEILKQLPQLSAGLRPAAFDFASDSVRIGDDDALTPPAQQVLNDALLRLSPWRKGPFRLCGVDVDAEWRSDLKWSRIATAADWGGKRVLDVGCGNGYYTLRALGAGATAVVGVDPSILAALQFAAVTWPLGSDPPSSTGPRAPAAAVLPLRLEELPLAAGTFDVVLSLGVLGHRRDPSQHLADLHARLPPGGQLVLETLIVDNPSVPTFVPEGRYAGMRNVPLLPNRQTLLDWVRAAGFREIALLDVTRTTTGEQRKTAWMSQHSLSDFLDLARPDLTREGHPGPVRAVVRALR